MNLEVSAHFDGKQVVFDEPAPFQPGEALRVRRVESDCRVEPADLLHQLAREQGVRPYASLEDMLVGIGTSKDTDADIWEIIQEERKERRAHAAEAVEPDWFR